MPNSEPYIEYYKGFQLIAKFYQDRFQGRALHRITKKKISAGGAAVSDIVASLKKAVHVRVAHDCILSNAFQFGAAPRR